MGTKTGAGSAPAVERLIATQTNATPQKKEVPKKEGPETPPDSPPLDLSDAAVKKLIRSANYVTHDQINSVSPSEEVNSEQIEDVSFPKIISGRSDDATRTRSVWR